MSAWEWVGLLYVTPYLVAMLVGFAVYALSGTGRKD